MLCRGCALHLGWTRWWEGAQVPPVKEMQEVCASWWWYSPLPQVTSPVWVWANLAAGRGGRRHQGDPSGSSTSTSLPTRLLGSPPVTRMPGDQQRL